MARLSITSSTNGRLKEVRRLRRRRARTAAGVFLVEGHRQVEAALVTGARMRELFAAPELFLGSADAALVAAAERRGVRVVELSAAAFESICDGVRPDGIAAVVERWPTALARLQARSLVLVAEGVERPGNLGTIVRSACAAGADGLLVCDAPVDVFHPDAVRGAVGTLFRLTIAESASAEAVAWLRGRGVRIVVATPEAERPHWRADYRGPVAIVVGSERHGVRPLWLDAADELVSIPMPGPADSLNVAVAAGVVLFEAARQRVEAGVRPR